MSRRSLADEYEASHWGQRGTRNPERLRAAVIGDGAELVLLGDLVSVTYRTQKGLDREPTDYEHAFGTPRPRLAYTRGGLLVIAGGRYRIEDRGIVG